MPGLNNKAIFWNFYSGNFTTNLSVGMFVFWIYFDFVAMVSHIQFCLATRVLQNMILQYTNAGYFVRSVFLATTERRPSLTSQQFFSFSRICITRDFESESGLWNCMAWFFYMDSIDSYIQIPFRLLHPLPSRYSRPHVKIINIHIWQKLASAVGMSWYEKVRRICIATQKNCLNLQ